MGSLYTRYNGVLFSKGKYIIFVDSDDIILKRGIFIAYNFISKNNLDMIEFHSLIEDNNSLTFIKRKYYKYSNIIYQPILSYIYYFKNNEGIESDTALWDKLIKRKIVLKSFKYIGKYLKEKIIIENDVILLFALFRNSKSYQQINVIGYYYFLRNNNSISNTKCEPNKADQILHSIFYNIKFLFEITKNLYLDKSFSIFKLEQGYKRYKICFKYIKSEYKLIGKIINNFLKSKYIKLQKKLIIKKIHNNILRNKSSNYL